MFAYMAGRHKCALHQQDIVVVWLSLGLPEAYCSRGLLDALPLRTLKWGGLAILQSLFKVAWCETPPTSVKRAFAPG